MASRLATRTLSDSAYETYSSSSEEISEYFIPRPRVRSVSCEPSKSSLALDARNLKKSVSFGPSLASSDLYPEELERRSGSFRREVSDFDQKRLEKSSGSSRMRSVSCGQSEASSDYHPEEVERRSGSFKKHAASRSLPDNSHDKPCPSYEESVRMRSLSSGTSQTTSDLDPSKLQRSSGSYKKGVYYPRKFSYQELTKDFLESFRKETESDLKRLNLYKQIAFEDAFTIQTNLSRVDEHNFAMSQMDFDVSPTKKWEEYFAQKMKQRYNMRDSDVDELTHIGKKSVCRRLSFATSSCRRFSTAKTSDSSDSVSSRAYSDASDGHPCTLKRRNTLV